MSWIEIAATEFKPNGQIDRKAQMDKESQKDGYTVLKSALRGTTYYAAIRNDQTNEVFAVVAPTSIDMSETKNFSYKGMTEFEGPNLYNCPKGILDLLTPTDNECANDWREDCYVGYSTR